MLQVNIWRTTLGFYSLNLNQINKIIIESNKKGNKVKEKDPSQEKLYTEFVYRFYPVLCLISFLQMCSVNNRIITVLYFSFLFVSNQ